MYSMLSLFSVFLDQAQVNDILILNPLTNFCQ